ncbi:ras-related protein Rab-12-like [Branchiostoma floridae]|uniref:Ras-related protein Rab-12 n=1 Tax=Branchiostoma floridae TaxID=7739 RepID=A0A9J7KN89_BRAFL|nr:ras-related protein Rab-12-like [Branchiostoma floridae]
MNMEQNSSSGGAPRASPAVPVRNRRLPQRPFDYKFQLILIGDRGVGKTCILERFSDDTFSISSKSTVGVDFKIKTIKTKGKTIRLQIWDTAGQERFNSISAAYYRGAKGVLVVYDITNEETFENLPKWLMMIDKHAAPDIEVIVIGNKKDKEELRQVSTERGEKFAYEHNCRFCEVSAKENLNVKDVFLKLVDDIVDKVPPEIAPFGFEDTKLSLPRSEQGGREPSRVFCCTTG